MEKRPLVCVYGDDFTGSTDSFAQLQRHGLTSVLLTKLPSREELTEVAASVDVLCVAGLSRSMPVAEIDRELRTVFAALAALHPRILQYKVCSTFDSSRTIGNIGRACEIAIEMFPGRSITVVPAQPDFGRYTVFGHHFARAADRRVYRLDRHPTMAVHPVTPMTESSLRRILIEQSDGLDVREIHLHALHHAAGNGALVEQSAAAGPPEVVVFDALTNGDLEAIAGLIWAGATEDHPAFCIGSGGISFGIASFLAHLNPARREAHAEAMKPVDAMLVVSGSCSALTAQQVDKAVAEGWEAVRVDPDRLTEGASAALQDSVVQHLSARRSVVVYTASGRPDSELADVALIGAGLAHIVEAALRRTGVRRVIVAGGDTSGYVMRALPQCALRLGPRIIENAVMCKTTSSQPWFDGIEVMLKGGQVGDYDLFERVRQGRTAQSSSPGSSNIH